MIRFCNQCGSPTQYAIPAGDNRPRHICPACGYIQYENPRMVVGCIATWHERILLCKRAIEPRHGFWTLPAGFMENGESTAQAALRETEEEAGAHILSPIPFLMVNLPHIDQIHLFYRGEMASNTYAAGEESLDVQLFDAQDIPWNDLAFGSVRLCLTLYLQERQQGTFGFHEHQLPVTPHY